jgi:hypothetical protein
VLGRTWSGQYVFWAEAADIIRPAKEGYEITRFGRDIFLGRESLDPYLEDIQTLWLIHWKLTTNQNFLIFTWDYLLNHFHEPELYASSAVRALEKTLRQNSGKTISYGSLEQLFDVFLRMSKAPEKFDIQFCKIEGIRSELFQRLSHILELSSKGSKVELLDLVRKLCGFIAQLPEYTRNTKRLSQSTLAVRNVILNAREPVLMLFHDLPVACGMQKFKADASIPPKDAQNFVTTLKDCLDELRMTFPYLQKRMTSVIAAEFGYDEDPISAYRQKLAERAGKLLIHVTESKLKAFAFRLFDEALPEQEWLESIGSLLALRPPSKWKDEEEDTFERELAIMTGRFKRAESLGFNSKSGKNQISNAIRIAVTQLDGTERQEVFHFEKEEERSLKELQNEISDLICKNKKLGLAAASRAIWSQIKSCEEGA